jgi:hypothetical protein
MLKHSVISNRPVNSREISVLFNKINLYDTKMTRFGKFFRYVTVFSIPTSEKMKEKVSNVPLK